MKKVLCLIAALTLALSSLGCTKINLQIMRTNADVVRFYERAGYAIEDRISMGKRLL